ncbi:MAG TPA: histone deacetylase [Thermomicrobiales bacterium]|nr:histone deacetylase [Thermomicrobiales bacterium]
MKPDSARTRVYRHRAFTGHDTTPHPENPSRVIAIDAELQRRGLLHDRPAPVWEPASDEQILRVHDARLLSSLKQLVASGGGAIDPDTIVFPDSLDVARLAAGAGIHAVEAIAAGEATTAAVLGRPPGHHATKVRSMGFCLLNTVAITAAHALATGFQRVAVIDWDVHHGNGTQDIFYDRADVLFCSSHRYGRYFYPGTGAASERGTGAGTGFTVNIPLTMGDGDAAITAALEQRILPAVRSYQPDLILISAGFDAHIEDPLGGLRVTDEGFRNLALRTRDLSRELTGGRLIAMLEGGYHPVASARCVADMIEVLDTPSP